MQRFHWSLTEIENMMPFEREIYLGILTKWLSDQAEKAAQRQS